MDEKADPALIKIEAAARRLSMSRSKAYQMAARGELPGAVRIAGSVRVSVKALDAWIDREAAKSGAA